MLCGRTAISYYVESLWFESLGYAGVFWKTLGLQWTVFASFAAATFVALFGWFLILMRVCQPDLRNAGTIVIGPSNPLASIAPILAVPGIHEALIAAPAPVLAVSPIVGGEVLKGPTAAFMAFAALDLSADGVADFYGELLDGIVADENVSRLVSLQTDTRMDDAAARRLLAEQVLGFAEALAK